METTPVQITLKTISGKSIVVGSAEYITKLIQVSSSEIKRCDRAIAILDGAK